MASAFRHRLRVRYSDCDPQGVVYFANHLAYFDVVMTELWREAIGPYEETIKAGVDSVVAEASVRHRGSVPFDEEVDLDVEIARLGTTGMTARLRITRDGNVLSEGELRYVFVVAGSNEKTPTPDKVRAGLEPYLVAD